MLDGFVIVKFSPGKEPEFFLSADSDREVNALQEWIKRNLGRRPYPGHSESVPRALAPASPRGGDGANEGRN